MPNDSTPPSGGEQDQTPRARTLGGYHYIDETGVRRWHALPCIRIEPDLDWVQMMARREVQS